MLSSSKDATAIQEFSYTRFNFCLLILYKDLAKFSSLMWKFNHVHAQNCMWLGPCCTKCLACRSLRMLRYETFTRLEIFTPSATLTSPAHTVPMGRWKWTIDQGRRVLRKGVMQLIDTKYLPAGKFLRLHCGCTFTLLFWVLFLFITKNAPYSWGNFHACAITRFQKPQQLSWAGRG